MAGKEYTTHCGTCGVLKEDRTPGCRQCQNRHNTWKTRKDPRYKPAGAIKCVKCGINVDEYTPGCYRCKARKRSRQLKQERKDDPNELRSLYITKMYYDAWVDARRKRIARRERLLVEGRRQIV